MPGLFGPASLKETVTAGRVPGTCRSQPASALGLGSVQSRPLHQVSSLG